jgi:glutaredoxin
MTYTLYTKPSCALCPTARQYLVKKQVPFIEISLDTPEAVQSFKERYPTVRSVPVLFDPNGTQILSWHQ